MNLHIVTYCSFHMKQVSGWRDVMVRKKRCNVCADLPRSKDSIVIRLYDDDDDGIEASGGSKGGMEGNGLF